MALAGEPGLGRSIMTTVGAPQMGCRRGLRTLPGGDRTGPDQAHGHVELDDSRTLGAGIGESSYPGCKGKARVLHSRRSGVPIVSAHEQIQFLPRVTVEQVEEGDELAPKFDEHGLLPVVTTAAATGEVLMLGYMNEEALKRTIATGEAHYYSRSREVLWHKGATSGLVQKVVELRIDDDQDAVWMRVEVAGSGASCHVGYRSCFFREVPVGVPAAGERVVLQRREDEKTFDPVEVYGDAPNPTKL